MKTIDLVRDFHATFCPENNGQSLKAPSGKVAMCRLQLIGEEAAELSMALAASDQVAALDALTDLQYVTDGSYLAWGVEPLPREARELAQPVLGAALPPPELCLQVMANINEALGYVSVASHGYHPELVAEALHELQNAIDDAFEALALQPVREAAFREVHASNMSKAGPDGKPMLNGAGRVLKGPNYFKPDLAKLINDYRVKHYAIAC